MDLIKKPYEISLWEDRLTAVFTDGTESSSFADAQKEVATQYYKEIKLFTIGSNTMKSPFRTM